MVISCKLNNLLTVTARSQNLKIVVVKQTKSCNPETFDIKWDKWIYILGNSCLKKLSSGIYSVNTVSVQHMRSCPYNIVKPIVLINMRHNQMAEQLSNTSLTTVCDILLWKHTKYKHHIQYIKFHARNNVIFEKNEIN